MTTLDERIILYQKLSHTDIQVSNQVISINVWIFDDVYSDWEAAITEKHDEEVRYNSQDKCFVLGIFRSGIRSVLMHVYPKQCPPNSGSTLLKLADNLNTYLGIQYCELFDDANLDLCGVHISMSLIFLLADGKNWYMRYGYAYNSDLVLPSLRFLANLRHLTVYDVFSDWKELFGINLSIPQAFQDIRNNLYTDACDTVIQLIPRLIELTDYLMLETTMVKDYTISSSIPSIDNLWDGHIDSQAMDILWKNKTSNPV